MIPGLGASAGGSMPISAGGGAAGPSTATSESNMGFKVGAINMGGGNTLSNWLPVLLALMAVWFLVKKVG
ncbi:hypothetical protein [Photobacterium indicum]|jgi:hypothetical protein|uniref:Uncharacterized protein n=1 Tax=Photobacterium indicum TaxID=81447 RepID=A0A2T3L8K2_9GAMM|nr:hypothetical protein [Photobacterium indicum]PSV47302.1 hypothetical protein C9J47_10500 [Photobacterium indicum]